MNPELKAQFTPTTPVFNQIMSLRGTVFRELENRCTQQITIGPHSYFVKQHFGVGWKEIFKNLLQLRLPVISAKNEWRALQSLHELSIPVPDVVGYGSRGLNPAQKQSFLITRALPKHISLEDYCKQWQNLPPKFAVKIKLIKQVAHIARTMHENGINHRDFYICHFLLDLSASTLQDPIIYLIDLHRAQIRTKVPKRWLIKDLAGLYFSSKDIGLTTRDLLRFMKEYRKKPVKLVLNTEVEFWQKVKRRGEKLYEAHTS